MPKVSETFKEFNLTPTQFGVMDMLNAKGRMKISELIDCMLATSGNMTVVIKNMEKKGMITLLCQAGNKKNKYIHLTATGKQLIDSIMVPLVKAEEEAFGMLTVQEQDILLPLLQKYANALNSTIGKITCRDE